MKIVLDAQLLLLLVVGTTSEAYVEKHKRLSAYTLDDYKLLMRMLEGAETVVVTPNTLTEVSNLARQIADPAKTEIHETIQRVIGLSDVEERLLESKVAASRQEFVRLGLADCVLLALADESHTILTADFDLYMAAANKKMKIENFNHYRLLSSS